MKKFERYKENWAYMSSAAHDEETNSNLIFFFF
jgi:hypothetical protein